MKKYIWSALTGMGFGFPITLLCMTVFGGFNEAIRELGIWMIASALYGVLAVAMDSDKLELSLPVSIGLHFGGCAAITLGASMACGYIQSLADVLPVMIPAVVIYIVICFVCFLLMKQNEKKINEVLEQK